MNILNELSSCSFFSYIPTLVAIKVAVFKKVTDHRVHKRPGLDPPDWSSPINKFKT